MGEGSGFKGVKDRDDLVQPGVQGILCGGEGLKGSIVGFEFDKRILNCHDVSRTVKGYFSLT